MKRSPVISTPNQISPDIFISRLCQIDPAMIISPPCKTTSTQHRMCDRPMPWLNDCANSDTRLMLIEYLCIYIIYVVPASKLKNKWWQNKLVNSGPTNWRTDDDEQNVKEVDDCNNAYNNEQNPLLVVLWQIVTRLTMYELSYPLLAIMSYVLLEIWLSAMPSAMPSWKHVDLAMFYWPYGGSVMSSLQYMGLVICGHSCALCSKLPCAASDEILDKFQSETPSTCNGGSGGPSLLFKVWVHLFPGEFGERVKGISFYI